MWTIRLVEKTDAAKVMNLQKALDRETRFMLMEPGELSDSVVEWEKRILPFIDQPHNVFWVVENAEGTLVGFLRARGQTPRRLAHSALIVIGILQEYWGQGIGTQLFEKVEAWAKERGLHRLELEVMVSNRRAIALYHKMGFVVEGLRRHAIRYADGQFVDEYMMAKLIH
ncbi:Protein N-acetyltransferase, RimJ/RimL family [Sulfobacillus thermosulfidooxidans DSM 9293]|uniref:Protein N-acetyltransferase, RimJ/RimL family n=1 Tax=Sulfobacillus thermosulfidooxidans (strain DSM 9293 / VKM B-1269 / AT-1) TaxID=929705 RepID=A0A1W1WIR4_SULTA|nr:GNAT family N-acetyltransferase [Sulfobacillus thermosulfidooxidans]SMC05930.1 Protein N-acetyltransferase, RimJ/RimL family [Sulfobacillus thermosulfidooxidans DSM 9293]